MLAGRGSVPDWSLISGDRGLLYDLARIKIITNPLNDDPLGTPIIGIACGKYLIAVQSDK